MTLRFCPVASGSSGNCIYAGCGGTHILIDAGISGSRVEKGLSFAGADRVDAILITHEHADHISGAGVLARRFGACVYASANTWRYINRHDSLGPVDPAKKISVEPGVPVTIGNFDVLPFEIPHDASGPVGYCLYADGKKITVATDIGHVNDTIRRSLLGSDICLIESNHDLDMLKNGRYPRPLKERVMGKKGHLSNATAGMLLADVASESMQAVYLGHLSEENNRPLLALGTVTNILEAREIKLKRLIVADRHMPSEIAEL
ncbi:MAG: MBL fold metallo-hydrolase [Defluviitaleaceae bacterium]|nr:MBL fold metallo-hydrolase [Defluviitaleaceae bacterium]